MNKKLRKNLYFLRKMIGHKIIRLHQPVGCQEENRFAQLIAMRPVLPMADGADREEHAQPRTQSPQAAEKGSIAFYNLLHLQTLTFKITGRKFMAIGNDNTCFPMAVNPGCTPGKNQKVRSSQPAGRVHYPAVDFLQTLLCRGRRKTAMMEETAPQPVTVPKVRFHKPPSFQQKFQGARHGQRVVNDTARIDIHLESEILQFLSNVLHKT